MIMKFRKKPVVIEAIQWFEIGDHKKVVPYYRTHAPKVCRIFCKKCDRTMDQHGWIYTLEGGHIVCPNDWIIKGVKGEFYSCKPDIFNMTYELVEENND